MEKQSDLSLIRGFPTDGKKPIGHTTEVEYKGIGRFLEIF